jgi:hypothetical protein
MCLVRSLRKWLSERKRADVRSLIAGSGFAFVEQLFETVSKQAELNVCARRDPRVFVASNRRRGVWL